MAQHTAPATRRPATGSGTVSQCLIDKILTHPDISEAMREALAYNPGLSQRLRHNAFLADWWTQGTSPAGAD